MGRHRVLALVLAIFSVVRVNAQSRIPALTTVRDLVIDAAANDLSPVTWVALAGNGTIAIGQAQDHLVRFFDAKGKGLGTLGRDGEGPGEFRQIYRQGWVGDTLWVSDMRTQRFTLISPGRKVVRTVRFARRVATSAHDTLQSLQVLASLWLFSGGDQIEYVLIPPSMRAHAPAWTSSSSNTGSGILFPRVSATGILRRVIVWYPQDPCGLDLSPMATLCPRPLMGGDPEGSRIVTATMATEGADSGTFRVVTIGTRADTIFARRYPFSAEPITTRVLDSLTALAATRPPARQIPGQETRKATPKVYPPLKQIVVGRDGTTWLELRATATGRPYLVLDPKGNPIGMATLPANVTLMAASRTTIWATQRDKDDVESVVRFRVGP
jgi:hypothetical protein